MPPSPARKALPERVAAAILDGAARTLAAQGPAASMTDVAAGAGVARATVYRYFPNRQVLLDELAVRALGETKDRLSSARLDEVPTQEGLSRVIRALVDLGDPFVVVARERARPEDFDRILSRPVDALLERGRDRGEIREDLPVRWLTESLLGIVLSVLTASPQRGREDTVAAITSLVLDGTTRRGPRLP
jgi:TetR/AcrR family transcriptional repressor of mexCD-oprJ operon